MNTRVEATESTRAGLRRLSVACGEWRGAAPYVRPSKCLAIIDTGHASTMRGVYRRRRRVRALDQLGEKQ